jgi:hypothetical protein
MEKFSCVASATSSRGWLARFYQNLHWWSFSAVQLRGRTTVRGRHAKIITGQSLVGKKKNRKRFWNKK